MNALAVYALVVIVVFATGLVVGIDIGQRDASKHAARRKP